MPIMDDQLTFCEALDCGSLSASSAIISTDCVYIPQVTDHLGSSTNDRPFLNQKLNWNMVVEDEAFDAATSSATVTWTLYHHTAAITTASIAASSATAITSVVMTVDASSANYPDGTLIVSEGLPNTVLGPYFAVYGKVTVQNLSAGKVTAWIGTGVQQGGEHGAL